MDLIANDSVLKRTQRIYLNSANSSSQGDGTNRARNAGGVSAIPRLVMKHNPQDFNLGKALIHPEDQDLLSVGLVHFSCNGNINMFGDEISILSLVLIGPASPITPVPVTLTFGLTPATTFTIGMTVTEAIAMINLALVPSAINDFKIEEGYLITSLTGSILINKVESSEGLQDLLGIHGHIETGDYIRIFDTLSGGVPVVNNWFTPNTGGNHFLTVVTTMPQQNYISSLETSNVIAQVPLIANRFQNDATDSQDTLVNYLYTNVALEGSHREVGSIAPHHLTISLFMTNGSLAVMNGNWDCCLEFKTLGRKK